MEKDLLPEIIAEISKALVLLGADRDIRGHIGSWRDTQTDEEVLANLKEWNLLASGTLFERLREFEAQEASGKQYYGTESNKSGEPPNDRE